MSNSREAAAKQFAHMQRIYKSYYSIASHKRIFGIAYNFGTLPEKDRSQIWFDKPLSSIIFDKQPLKLLESFNYVVHEVELGVLLGMQGRNI
jgi:hypothetical protein